MTEPTVSPGTSGQKSPGGDVDDLIFRGESGQSASQR